MDADDRNAADSVSEQMNAEVSSGDNAQYADPTPARRRRWIALSMVIVASLGIAAFAVGRADAPPDVQATAEPVTTTSTTSTSELSTPTTAAPTTATPPASTPAAKVQQPVSATTYAFPIEPAATAKPSSSHHDYPASDVFAPCGSNIVATTTGSIQEITLIDKWSSKNDLPELRGGLSYSLVGDDGVRYYGSHLQTINASIRPGARVATGDRIGTVGETGNAAGTGCHLHFGISKPCGPGDVLRRRGELWPQQYLRAWKVGEQRSPVPEIQPRSC